MVHVLVTGGAGFIGSHVCERLHGAGHRVRVLDDFSTGRGDNLAGMDGIDVVQGCITDASTVSRAMDGCTHVVHLAALVSVAATVEDPLRNDAVNIGGTLHVLESARRAGVARVVLAASAAAYGANPELPKRESMRPEPLSPYAVAKVANEHYAAVYTSLYDLPVVPLRFFNVYGPRQDPSGPYSGVISKFAQVLAERSTPTIFGDGRQSRDFVFVGDIVDAVERALLGPAFRFGEPINLGTGESTTLLDLLTTLGTILEHAPPPRFAAPRAGDIRDSVASVERARDELQWKAATSLHDGLRALVDSIRGTTL